MYVRNQLPTDTVVWPAIDFCMGNSRTVEFYGRRQTLSNTPSMSVLTKSEKQNSQSDERHWNVFDKIHVFSVADKYEVLRVLKCCPYCTVERCIYLSDHNVKSALVAFMFAAT